MPLPPLILGSLLLLAAPQATECADSVSCRNAAMEAKARGDYETFHDLAWRAVQRGKRHDPDLMYLLARAQSLSGRPGDALVMLRRLTELGIATEAREDEDFRRVRALPGWPEIESRIAALPESGDPASAATLPPSLPGTPTAPADAAPGPAAAAESAPSVVAPAGTPAERTAGAAAVPPAASRENAMRLTATGIDPVSLAYDTVSRRFVVGDRRANKVVIADEVFNHVNDLVSAASGGFGGLTALAIDSRRGDLWVASSGMGGAASIHRLQLVSGRLLATVEVSDDLRPIMVTDLAITDSGTLLLADAAGSRLLTMKATNGRLERPSTLRITQPASIAAAGEVTYIAHDKGLTRADLASGRTTGVRAGSGVDLSRLQRIRWYRGSLIALQQTGTDGSRLVRIRLAPGGGVATAVEPLDDYPATDGGALTISRDAAYFVTQVEGDPVIRRVDLR